MPTGRRAAAGTDPPRKTGTARNATSFSAGTPPIWHSVERADPDGTPPAMPVFVPARFEERRQGCRRGNLKGYSTRGDSPSLLRQSCLIQDEPGRAIPHAGTAGATDSQK